MAQYTRRFPTPSFPPPLKKNYTIIIDHDQIHVKYEYLSENLKFIPIFALIKFIKEYYA